MFEIYEVFVESEDRNATSWADGSTFQELLVVACDVETLSFWLNQEYPGKPRLIRSVGPADAVLVRAPETSEATPTTISRLN